MRRDFWFAPTVPELRELLDKASPVPWYPTTTAGQSGALTCHASGPDHPRPNQIDWHPQAEADAYLIAAMRNSLWQMIDIISDLAAKEPRDPGHANKLPQCTLCGASVAQSDWEAYAERHGWNALNMASETTILTIPHAESCPYRRAGDLTSRRV